MLQLDYRRGVSRPCRVPRHKWDSSRRVGRFPACVDYKYVCPGASQRLYFVVNCLSFAGLSAAHTRFSSSTLALHHAAACFPTRAPICGCSAYGPDFRVVHPRYALHVAVQGRKGVLLQRTRRSLPYCHDAGAVYGVQLEYDIFACEFRKGGCGVCLGSEIADCIVRVCLDWEQCDGDGDIFLDVECAKHRWRSYHDSSIYDI